MKNLEINIQKRFDSGRGEPFTLDVGFSIPEGRITVIFGPSGSGKSTLLRLIAGLEKGEGGYIRSAGISWFDAANSSFTPPQQRGVAMLFQNLSLFPHMTVRDNIEYAAAENDPGRIDELMTMTELLDLEGRYPHELSGGQCQRLAIARALAQKPGLLLLDEPFSALDSAVKKRLYDELISLQKKFGFTAVMVSHDMAEAYRLAEHAIILKEGRVTKEGPPEEVFLGKSLSTRIQIPARVISMESDEIHTLLTVEEGRRTFRVFVDNDEAEKISIGDEVVVAAKASEALVFKV
ncbi:MAG: ABC transporter ATP-binding protein [Proteobacteria bacterium]|nr:ABC transporter ATP-binding protein [Pseudomonadota bacterium]